MHLLARILREPLVHFLVIGAAVFAFYGLTLSEGEAPAPRDRIVVSEGRVRQLAEIFTRTWQRPPSEEELRGLVAGHVKEEVYYREAVKLGLDRDDTVIRRRMQQKMEFLTEPPEDALQPEEAELEAFLAANRTRFRVDPHLAFRQVFIRADTAGAAALQRASALLETLRRNGLEDSAGEAGDPTLLPAEMALSPLRLIERTFGGDFADDLLGLPKGEWSGPVASPYGLHLVRIEDMVEAYDPPLAEVRDLVLQEWRHAQRQAYAEQAYRRLLDSYEVSLPEGFTTDGTAVWKAGQ